MFDLIKYLAENDINHTVSDSGNITVIGVLDLENVSGIDALPDNLTVGGSLDLSGTRITALPDNLTVGGSLDLSGTRITALPDNFSCSSLYLDAERISNIAFRHNCGNSCRTIFAAWTGNEYRIAAGCFFGTIEQFENAVDDSYSGDAAEAYKKAGRDCVAELTKKLNPEG
ncbi:hypothetical protein [Escherichia coli]|uniref:hypothetical protein n=1 Tax=Escherichia coli TaxID=562 RepID=UPI00191AD3B0|nr:hypothetical protein [Escherichia coli]CAD6098563.1 Uncharacterised protein [Escherichia coli]CAD6176692.1 Uncharacterised protein [Escherichia coli]